MAHPNDGITVVPPLSEIIIVRIEALLKNPVDHRVQ
jgi:hypothetical protein